jgi:RNA polymerase sigma-70 factor (ECF subfamily)
VRDAILAGDEAAAEAFCRAHLDSLYEFVHYRLGSNPSQVEDVVQDTFVVAIEKLGEFDGHSTLHTWLCGIAKNKIRSFLRKRSARSISDVLVEADEEIDAILAQVAREPLPEWVLEREETRELVGATLSSLPPAYRKVLVDKYVDERSVAQIAERASLSAKAAESRLHRARLAFVRVFELLARRRGELA